VFRISITSADSSNLTISTDANGRRSDARAIVPGDRMRDEVYSDVTEFGVTQVVEEVGVQL
jgi:hypothetical protein